MVTKNIRSITFKGLNSFDNFGLKISDFQIGLPDKIEKTKQMPNGIVYDWTSVYGDIYTERILKVEFDIVTTDKGFINTKKLSQEELQKFKSKIVNWLMGGSKSRLDWSGIPDKHFNANVIKGIETQDLEHSSKLIIEFSAYSHMIANNAIANDNLLWDPFEFSVDKVTQGIFTLDENSVEINVFNSGTHSVNPLIKTTGVIRITTNTDDIHLDYQGNYSNTPIKLFPGNNFMKVTGPGTVEFLSYAEDLL